MVFGEIIGSTWLSLTELILKYGKTDDELIFHSITQELESDVSELIKSIRICSKQ